MKTCSYALSCVAALVLMSNAYAQDAKVLQPEEPVVLKAHKLQPYEVAPGTIITIGVETRDRGPKNMDVGLVTHNVYDHYQNVAIPAGSKLIGKAVSQVNNRHEVLWNGLQVPSVAATLELNPPIEATMPDGSTGIVGFKPGQQVGAIVGNSFIVPQ